MGVVVFSLLFGCFPVDEARPSDPRFVVARYAQATNQSTLAALIGMYPGNQEAANTLAGLSGRTRNILEGMLTIAPEQRAILEAPAATVMSVGWVQVVWWGSMGIQGARKKKTKKLVERILESSGPRD